MNLNNISTPTFNMYDYNTTDSDFMNNRLFATFTQQNLIEELIDFEELNKSEVKLFSCATNVKKGKPKDPFELKVSDLTEDDEIIGEWTKFMDILVGKEGNVEVTMRNTDYEIAKTILFKTAENGGKFPIMANVFTRLARALSETRRAVV